MGPHHFTVRRALTTVRRSSQHQSSVLLHLGAEQDAYTTCSVGRLNHASLLVGRKIVIHGGWDGKGATMGDLWVFDTENFAWLQPKVAGLSPSPR